MCESDTMTVLAKIADNVVKKADTKAVSHFVFGCREKSAHANINDRAVVPEGSEALPECYQGGLTYENTAELADTKKGFC